MTTALDIIAGAYARRTANDPERLASKQELVGHLSRILRRIYADVAKVNPEFFGEQETVIPEDGRWPRPAEATVVFRVENADGDEVHRVPFRDRFGEIAPRIYALGRFFYSVGQPADPDTGAVADPTAGESAGDDLVFFYSKRHPALNQAVAPDHEDNELDDTWPEHYNELLVAYLARYLAIKDGRTGTDLGPLDAEITEMTALLMQEAQLDDYGERRRWTERPTLG